MKCQTFRSIVFVLLVMEARAQVSNDDCAGALAVVYQAIGSWHCDPDQIGEGFGLSFPDSTDLFGPNFPYPTAPAPCLGYTASVAAPANDVWYAFTGYCTLQFTIEAVDTCHVSAWCGGSCAQLTTRGCLTVLPGQTYFYSFDGISTDPTLDTLLLQISSTNLVSHAEYQFCILNPPDPGCLQPAEFSSSTPVTCFAFDVHVTNSSDPYATDGAIEVEMQLGLSPFTISWDDGHVGEFNRTGLASGTYVFTLVDSIGCEQTGAVVVGIETIATTITPSSSPSPYGTVQDPVHRVSSTVVETRVFDSRGMLVAVGTGQQMPDLPCGIYVVKILYADGTFLVSRLAVTSHLDPR